MRKNRVLIMIAVLCAVSSIALFGTQSTQAAKKKPVKATVKGKTLTISGKGAMPSSLKLKGKKAKKIKKVVIKKGITSIPINAFSKYKNVQEITASASVKSIGQYAFSCKKLKKLTIPGSFKIKTYSGDYADYAYQAVAGNVKTVVFNSNLKLRTAAYFTAENLIVKKSDPKYKSIGGVVYSKDGKELVRVPFQRKELIIEEGCETFCLQAVLYGGVDAEGDNTPGCVVRSITIPASVKRVESDKYYAITDGGFSDLIPGYDNNTVDGLKVVIKSKQLDGQSFSELVYRLGMKIEDLMKQVPEQISYADNMYVTSDHLLLKYRGKNSTVTIPSHIKKVGDYAFFYNEKITKLVLEPGVEEIGKESFYRAFSDNVIQRIVLPPSVKKVGADIFGREEFKGTVEIQGSSKGISSQAFPTAGGLLSYTKGAKEKKTSINISSAEFNYGKKVKVEMHWSRVKGVSGYEAVFSTDSKFKKNTTKVKLKANQTSKTITVKVKVKPKSTLYVRIRPYTMEKGKKVYGRWSEDTVR